MVTQRCNDYGGGRGNEWCDLEPDHDGMHHCNLGNGVSVGWGWPKWHPYAKHNKDHLRVEPLWCVESPWRTFWRLGGWR